MQFFKHLLPIVVAMGFATTSPLAADGHGHGHGGGHDHHGEEHHEHGFAGGGQDRSRYLQEINERDWEALRDYINTKREGVIEENTGRCDLTISGDVRFEYRNLHEKGVNWKRVVTKEGDKEIVTIEDIKYQSLRGGNAIKEGKPVSNNDFDVEFNLRFDYNCEKTWAVAHLDFDNSAGVDGNGRGCCDPVGFHGSGNCDSVCLKKAYFGYNAYTCGDVRVDIELGRRNLYNVFDSQIQFLSRFDGITLKYSDNVKGFADWYWNTAGFVIDERVNHFGWVTEIGFLDIMDSRIDLKYSFIDWRKKGKNRCFNRNPRGFDFVVSQWTTAYHFDKAIFGKPAKAYGAFLKNHSGVKIHLPKEGADLGCVRDDQEIHGEKSTSYGWYVGFIVGEVVKEGDYAFSCQYEWVGAVAMPDEDAAGIGNGNILNRSITEVGIGNTNYKGFKFELLYAVTDNLSLDTIVEFSRQVQTKIGGRHHYSKFELEAIYAF